MESNLIKVPFDLEMAKKITNGELEGRVVTRDGKKARIVCWDKKSDSTYYIVALIDVNIMEKINTYTINGLEVEGLERDNDLMLEIPEHLTFTNGDILISSNNKPFIYKEVKNNRGAFGAYFGVDLIGNEFFDCDNWTCEVKGRADETQLKIIIDQLKSSKDPRAKKYLKSFLNIELKPEYKFKPYDKVLVRNYIGTCWVANIFSNQYEIEGKVRYSCCGNAYNFCIPYNDQTKHLLGTTDNWED